MSSPIDDRPSANQLSATEDPFVSPEFHLRNRSLSFTSHASGSSSRADFYSNASASRDQRSAWQWPSSILYQFSLLKAIPRRWCAVLLCLTATILVWRLPPPSIHHLSLHLEQHPSASAPQVLRPLDFTGSPRPDPERWLKEHSEEALSRNRGWWKGLPPKPRAAIISLVRNEELEGIMQSIRQLEFHWNRKYQYPWIFFNEKPFSDEFKVLHEPVDVNVC
jgi:Glycolipid 2-alpha-mannosyltransferase